MRFLNLCENESEIVKMNTLIHPFSFRFWWCHSFSRCCRNILGGTVILGTNHGTILGCQCSHATSVRGALGLSTQGLVSGPYGDSRLILPTQDL